VRSGIDPVKHLVRRGGWGNGAGHRNRGGVAGDAREEGSRAAVWMGKRSLWDGGGSDGRLGFITMGH
jgi:hypothetical protein